MNILINIISFITYFAILLGIYLIFEKPITDTYNRNIRFLYRKRKRNKLFNYLKKIYSSISVADLEKEIDSKVNTFIFVSISLFVIVFIIIFKYNLYRLSVYGAVIQTILPSFLIAIIPFCSLRIKLFNVQRNSSKEALILTSEILNQYKIYNNNITEALDATIANLDKTVICRRYLIRLSMRIKEHSNDNELFEIMDEFVFSVNTNWIKMLADSILFAIINNVNITLSLEGLIEQIGSIEETKSVGNRLNNEGFVMAKYLAPILYIVLVLVSVKMLGFSFQEFLYYQFTGDGLKMFVVTIILFVGCYIAEYLYKSKKYDF